LARRFGTEVIVCTTTSEFSRTLTVLGVIIKLCSSLNTSVLSALQIFMFNALYKFIHSFIHSFTHSFIHSLITHNMLSIKLRLTKSQQGLIISNYFPEERSHSLNGNSLQLNLQCWFVPFRIIAEHTHSVVVQAYHH